MTRTVITVAAAALATAASLLTISAYAHQRDARQADINTAVCVQVARIDNAISSTIKRSLRSLPKIQYYRDHPDELRSQERETRRTLKLFIPPTQCSEGIPTRR